MYTYVRDTYATTTTTEARHLSISDLQDFVDQLGDEILTHQNIGAASSSVVASEGLQDLGGREQDAKDIVSGFYLAFFSFLTMLSDDTNANIAMFAFVEERLIFFLTLLG